jgi:hyperosmotically inducible protein
MQTTIADKQNLLLNGLLITGCLAAVLALVACQPEGDAEKAGKKIDRVVSDGELQIDNTSKKTEKKIEVAKDAVINKAETAGEYIDDAVITTNVKSAILDDAMLKSSLTDKSILKLSKIEVTTTNGVVQLTGTVDSQSIVDRAMEVAKSQKHVKSVQANLLVASPEQSK